MNLSLFLFFFFINPPCSAATQWMAIKCISEIRSYVKLQQLLSPTYPLIFTGSQSAEFGVV